MGLNLIGVGLAILLSAPYGLKAQTARTLDHWTLQDSQKAPKGSEITQPHFDDQKWYRVRLPNTVLGTLVDNKVFQNPFWDFNFRLLPGTTYPLGSNFSLIPMPQDSPFQRSWWYRTQVEIPLSFEFATLRATGINGRAALWVNTQSVTSIDPIQGYYRDLIWDISALVRGQSQSAIAFEIQAPQVQSLSRTWIDWNPMPADKNMGLTGDVKIKFHGAATIEQAWVKTQFKKGHWYSRVFTRIKNWSQQNLEGSAIGFLDRESFMWDYQLRPLEEKLFTSHEFEVLEKNLWWPHDMGKPHLVPLSLHTLVNNKLSDSWKQRVGLREVKSELSMEGYRLFSINNKPVFIKGAGWNQDIFFRSQKENWDFDFRSVRDLGLNTLRLEGLLESPSFHARADEEGIMILSGFPCCSHWEQWKSWSTEDILIAKDSFRSQIRLLSSHASTLAFLMASDHPPPAPLVSEYIQIKTEEEIEIPHLVSASQRGLPYDPTGVKMTGPYDYTPPSYWSRDTQNGGAHGFNMETGPGFSIPLRSSLERFLSTKQIWPLNWIWDLHAGGGDFQSVAEFKEKLARRYGPVFDLDDFINKADAYAYESHRAMFEAYRQNRFHQATGVIYWMLKSAWPSMIWHLYDYFENKAGSYYGTKKAHELISLQYAHSDHTVRLLNDALSPYDNVTAQISIYDTKSKPLFQRSKKVSVHSGENLAVSFLPDKASLPVTYFMDLRLIDSNGSNLSHNFYWLSTQDEIYDWANTTYRHTPLIQDGDLRLLNDLGSTQVSARMEDDRFFVTNTGSQIAFLTQIRLIDVISNQEINDVLWTDNYLSLLPGEERSISYVNHSASKNFKAKVTCWNCP